MREGIEGEELRELTELDMTGYATKRRLIRRRIDKAFPQGWKP
jgi:RNA polymerase sigma-70 factor (ECF subfamily)